MGGTGGRHGRGWVGGGRPHRWQEHWQQNPGVVGAIVGDGAVSEPTHASWGGAACRGLPCRLSRGVSCQWRPALQHQQQPLSAAPAPQVSCCRRCRHVYWLGWVVTSALPADCKSLLPTCPLKPPAAVGAAVGRCYTSGHVCYSSGQHPHQHRLLSGSRMAGDAAPSSTIMLHTTHQSHDAAAAACRRRCCRHHRCCFMHVRRPHWEGRDPRKPP